MKSEIKFQVSKTYGAGRKRRLWKQDVRTQCGAHLWAAKAKGVAATHWAH